jgi:hypothetical protein
VRACARASNQRETLFYFKWKQAVWGGFKGERLELYVLTLLASLPYCSVLSPEEKSRQLKQLASNRVKISRTLGMLIRIAFYYKVI